MFARCNLCAQGVGGGVGWTSAELIVGVIDETGADATAGGNMGADGDESQEDADPAHLRGSPAGTRLAVGWTQAVLRRQPPRRLDIAQARGAVAGKP